MTKYTEESTSSYESEVSESISTYESDNDQSETEETEHDLALTARYKNSDIRNIAIETIDDNYFVGKLGPLEVLMMSSNGYVNISKVCKACNKKVNHWKDNASSKEFMSALIKYDKTYLKRISERYAEDNYLVQYKYILN